MKFIQRTSLTLVFLICVVNYVDRGTLSVANLPIRDELGLSVAAMGALFIGLSLALCVHLAVFRRAGRSIGPRRVLAALVLWSNCTGPRWVRHWLTQFIIARALLGYW